MIVFPNAKINLGLQVTEKRPDGFHAISTVFYPVACTDILEVVRSEAFTFSTSGLPINGAVQQNLCYKAYEILQKTYDLPPVSVHLHKVIPMGAGIGGGSADGAFMLKLLNQLFDLGISDATLAQYALGLGSDCPFFIWNKPAYATGRGEILEPISLPALDGKKVLLVNPGLHINTGWAFSQLTPRQPAHNLKQIVQDPVPTWKGRVQNDFEPVVFAAFPALKNLVDNFYRAGALFAGMTGTGSTFYGIFDELPEEPAQFFDPSHKIYIV